MKEIIAIDLGGTNLRVSLIEANGENRKILKYSKKPTPKTVDGIVNQMISMISELNNVNVKAIGISSPGPLKDGIIKNPPNLPFKNYNLKATLEKRFKKPVFLEHDAKCIAVAELKLGCKKDNFLMIAIGTGIGGGLISDGKLYKGTGYGGEIGHIIIDDGNDFETLAASKLLKKLTKKKFGKELMVNDLLKMKNKDAEDILEIITNYLGQGIGSLINVFDPELVVLSGGLKENGEALLNRIKKKVRLYSVLPKRTPIQWTKLDHPGTLGASLLIK
jgi:glucokinase